VDLQTTFGGGKTHSMISLYHLFAGVPLKDLPQDLQDLLASEKVSELPKVRRAVIVGTRLVPAQAAEKPDGCQVGTIWGEIAWQLGGKKAYDYIRSSDESRTSPGDRIRKVIEDAAPCVILIDEWVAYAAQLMGAEELRAGDFNTQFYFAQTLTEVVNQVPGALLVVSLPASVDAGGAEIQVQVAGSDAHQALRKLRDAIGRKKDPWTPATAEEGFEIVRRRLFQAPDAENLKYVKATAKAFSEFYGKQAAEFPPEAREAEYSRRIERSYPIHPELFTRLYDDWSTLERFQRTRGVLRLMAQVIHALWSNNDRSPMIMPGLLPIDDPTVANEIVSNLSEQWPPIIHRDVDGEESTPRAIDLQYPNLNQYAATRRVARTVMLGSAPSLNSANRGIEIQRVRLGSVMPGEQVAVFNDALAKLLARATYLYNEGTRYWYGTQAHVGQLARDRAEQIRSSRGDIIEREIRERLTSMSSPRHEFTGVHVMPTTAADVADSDEARLVILSPEQSQQGRGESAATAAARAILEQRGNAARLYKNMLTFLVPEQRHVEALLDSAAAYLAWKQLDAEKVSPLNFDPLNQKQVQDRLREATTRLDASVREAYKIALVPLQPDAATPVELDVVRCDGADGLAERCSKKLVNQGMLNTAYSTEMLRSILDGVLSPMWATGHCSVKDLWDVFARYTYLPRFKNMAALVAVLAEGANRIGWEQTTWALAAGVKPDGGYVDLVGGSLAMGVNGTWLIVRPEVAAAQINSKPAPQPGPGPVPGPGPQQVPGVPNTGGSVPGPAAPTRFWGRKELNPAAAQMRRDFEKVEQEVVALLQRELGSEVSVTITIEVVNESGFSETVVRNVKANADTLRFDEHGFA
jgi:predicted AAA+ superfamily ATPase